MPIIPNTLPERVAEHLVFLAEHGNSPIIALGYLRSSLERLAADRPDDREVADCLAVVQAWYQNAGIR